MRRTLALAVATICAACTSTPAPSAVCAPHLSIPEWITPSAASTTATTLAPPTADDRFTTKTLDARTKTRAREWSARTIDLDVADADIHDVCRLLAEVGKTNIVVADDVVGHVTVKMKHVPWDQALDAILRTMGFVSERDGDVILVRSQP